MVVTEILKKTTTANDNGKMVVVDENVCTSIIFSVLNSDSNFYHQCLREYYISPFCLNKKHVYMSKWRQELTIGSKLDCLDFQNDWYSCTVIDFNHNTNEVLIHYLGWEEEWNEWVARDNPRLQPFKSVANGNRELGSVRKPMTSVVAKNLRKYEDSDENDSRNTKKFGIFRGLSLQNISFRLVEAMNVFGENNGFKLLLKILPLMKNMRNVRCILTVLEKVCVISIFFFNVFGVHFCFFFLSGFWVFVQPFVFFARFGYFSCLAHILEYFVMNTYHYCVIALWIYCMI